MTVSRATRCAWFSGLTIFLSAVAAVPVNAQEEPAETTTKAPSNADANNPLAQFTALNFHNYYIPAISGADDQNANTFWLRYAQPMGKWLFRGSLPVSRVPTGVGETTSGLGDFNALATYLFDTGDPAVSFGVGPQIVAPTATEDETGTGKWQAGLATIYFNTKSPTFQWGGLVTWQTDFAGDDERPGTNMLAIQPFYFVQLGKGVYVRGVPIAVFNLDDGSYHVPLSLGLGKVVPTKGVTFNVFVEPQFTILDRGDGWPEFQIFVGFNTQFARK